MTRVGKRIDWSTEPAPHIWQNAPEYSWWLREAQQPPRCPTCGCNELVDGCWCNVPEEKTRGAKS